MQIILLHPRLTQAKTVTLTTRHIVLAVAGLIITVLLLASLVSYFVMTHAPLHKIPFMADVVLSSAEDDSGKNSRFVKENLAMMSIKLGEMQAQLMRLDALGERVQGLAGIKPETFSFKEKPGQGGAEPVVGGNTEKAQMSFSELNKMLDSMGQEIGRRADYMNVVETSLMGLKIKSRLLPTTQPVDGSYNASGFGIRFDPFTGRRSVHEGIDFPAPIGSPIVAAAGGVVIAAEYHPDYGNMVDIDHGNDIITRYGHASRLHANIGDIVKRGQHIADIGSTGRSTGPHLHFEVRVKGVPQNPHKFLSAGADQSKLLALAGH
ncbi:MAG: M23 family metallopeptidase [Burkholderiaceae bacterium]|nr:M23 family metallopeptidase [Burkholderiaceae bacterium]